MKIALLAGTQSGCGKTTIMLALLQYLKQHQQKITAFKAGPDFLDPLWHQVITEQPSYNIDTQMIGLEASQVLINQQQARFDFALIEGVMGLFDGRSGVGLKGSSADLARGLDCSVILVINAKGISGSVVPLVSGYCDYAQQMGVKIAGIIANHVGSPHHATLLTQFLVDYELPPLLAWMKKNAPVLAERHLGLVMPDIAKITDYSPYFHVNNELLLASFTDWQFKEALNSFNKPLLLGKKIAISKDEACCFIYPANIDWLKQQGAEIAYFSVLKGEPVPEKTDAVWLTGGYPELYAEQLSTSSSWHSLRQFILADKPVLAECGGSVILGQYLIDLQGKQWRMSGILPFYSEMQAQLASLGYREEKKGVKGHEFHYSVRHNQSGLNSCFQCPRGDQGVRYRNVRASYIHWYFASESKVVASWLTLNNVWEE